MRLRVWRSDVECPRELTHELHRIGAVGHRECAISESEWDVALHRLRYDSDGELRAAFGTRIEKSPGSIRCVPGSFVDRLLVFVHAGDFESDGGLLVAWPQRNLDL